MAPEDAVAALAKQNLGCIFTEHVDYDLDCKPFFCADLETYFNEYPKYRSDTVLMGLEIGLLAECEEINRAHAAHPGLDYCIGSVHFTSGHDLGLSPEFILKAGEALYGQYLAFMLEMIELNDFFDALGHIDYMSRYSPFAEENVLYKEYAGPYDKILKTLIERDKVLELSTKRLHKPCAYKNLYAIYRRYRDLGGKYVTLGSDAHKVENLGCNFDIAARFTKEIGLVPVYYKERRRILCKPI
jgi:histidinol-phosphatase (PHP family)